MNLTAPPYSPLRLMALALSATLVPLGSTMIAVALPDIGAEFAKEPGLLTQWLVSSYLLVGIIGQSPGGKLGDYWGYEKTLRLGQGVFGFGSLLAALYPHFAAVAVSRVLMAAGGAFMVPTVMAVARVTVPPEKRHRIFGYIGAMMGMAAAIGPFLGGFLVHHFGWRSVFLMNFPPLILSIAVSWTYFKDTIHQKPEHGFVFDYVGTGLMTLWLVLLVGGLKGKFLLLGPALLGFGAFLWWESRVQHPLLNLKLFAHRAFGAGCAMVGLQNLGMYALLFQMPYLLKLLYQWEPSQAGHTMTFFMISMMVGSALGGRVAEKLGVLATCMAGSLISVGGFTLLSILERGEGVAKLIGALILGGAGLGLANGPSQSAALGSIDKKESGIASGVLATSRYLGGVFGISILGFLLSRTPTGASLADHREALWIFAGSFAVTVLVSLLFPGKPPAKG
ncbi:MAG TPA: MFS transporter [bacterium]|nr:MFS transporter [bacterium]